MNGNNILDHLLLSLHAALDVTGCIPRHGAAAGSQWRRRRRTWRLAVCIFWQQAAQVSDRTSQSVAQVLCWHTQDACAIRLIITITIRRKGCTTINYRRAIGSSRSSGHIIKLSRSSDARRCSQTARLRPDTRTFLRIRSRRRRLRGGGGD